VPPPLTAWSCPWPIAATLSRRRGVRDLADAPAGPGRAAPARAPESVLVFEKAPEQPYSVIARVESIAGNVFKGFDDLRLRTIDQEAQLGGDAVIVGPESTTTEFIILTTGMIPSGTKKLTGEVIIFR